MTDSGACLGDQILMKQREGKALAPGKLYQTDKGHRKAIGEHQG